MAGPTRPTLACSFQTVQFRPMPTPTLVVAATGSGCGKTTVVAGLLAALRRCGLVVQPFKCGPDYIDPGYHTRAAGRTCRNLDSWMLDDAQVAACFERACRGADLAVVEGVMGLFDGSSFTDERASAAQIAKLLGAPVLLILDISGSARSAAAMAHGFATLDPQLHVGACVLNFAGSESHARGCAEAIAQLAKLPTHGWLPRVPELAIPERHLGLALAGEQTDLDTRLARLAAAVEQRFDLDAIIALATRSDGFQPVAPDSNQPVCHRAEVAAPPEGQVAALADRAATPAPSNLAGTEAGATPHPACSTVAQASLPAAPDSVTSPASALSGLRSPVSGSPSPVSGFPPPLLAVAHDEAFCFHYPDNLDLLEAAGARLAYFRPAHGERLPVGAAGVYLGGGYPELHAAALSANQGFFDDLHALHARGAPIYAECGGFMVLTEALFDLDGRRWPMAGLVPDTVRMTPDLVALGYRHATAACNHLLADAGTTLRGHEFHHSRWEPAVPAAANAWHLRGTDPAAPSSIDGHAYDNLLASYLHIHFAQDPAIATRFVARLRAASG